MSGDLRGESRIFEDETIRTYYFVALVMRVRQGYALFIHSYVYVFNVNVFNYM